MQKLGNLTLIYDDNEISIEDDTRIAKNEDVGARYAAYGWDVQHVDWRKGDPDQGRLPRGRRGAVRGDPGGPGGHRPAHVHRAAHDHRLAGAEQAEHRQDPRLGAGRRRGRGHQGDPRLRPATRRSGRRGGAGARPPGRRARPRRPRRVAAGLRRLGRRQPRRARPCSTGCPTRTLPEGWHAALPEFPADAKGIATRAASGKVLGRARAGAAGAVGRLGRPGREQQHHDEGRALVHPEEYATKAFPGHEYGRTLHFGIREHGMGSILNGIAAHGGTRPYGGTFLVFSDYMRGAVRLSALMKLPVIYVWTHDSIGLGEDGPTHQPIETLTALRAIVGLDVVRPADANETAWAWRGALEHTDRPTALALSRQNLPTIDRSKYASAEGILKGGYVLSEASGGEPKVILIGTGSEVSDLPDRPGAAGGGGHPDPGRVDAVPGVVLRAGHGLPAAGAAARRQGAGDGRGRHRG